MMGGPEECNHMLLAQRDMIKLERDFYKEESVQLLLKLSIVFVLILPFFFMGISL